MRAFDVVCLSQTFSITKGLFLTKHGLYHLFFVTQEVILDPGLLQEPFLTVRDDKGYIDNLVIDVLEKRNIFSLNKQPRYVATPSTSETDICLVRWNIQREGWKFEIPQEVTILLEGFYEIRYGIRRQTIDADLYETVAILKNGEYISVSRIDKEKNEKEIRTATWNGIDLISDIRFENIPYDKEKWKRSKRFE